MRSVRRCLRKIIGRASLTLDELSTIIIEVESVINSRPITYLYDDTEGISRALSPSHLIYGRRILDDPYDNVFEIAITQESLIRKASYHRHLLKEVLKRWKCEYLLGLREIASTRKLETEPQVSVGDVVLLYEEQFKRNYWKICKFEELIVGSDGHVRAAKKKAPTKSGTTVLTRSLKHLIPLEVKVSEFRSEQSRPELEHSEESSRISDSKQVDWSCSNRPRRTATTIGEIWRRDNYNK